MKKWIRENGLSLVLLGLFLFSLIGQALAGYRVFNEDELLHGGLVLPFSQYLLTPHFVEAMFENWESEFLQMAAYVLLTIGLRQKGSAESKPLEGKEPVDEDPRRAKNRRDVPWPVRRGGWVLRVYENSLSLGLLLLFGFSFVMHAWGGNREHVRESLEHGELVHSSTMQYLGTARFWFESFQNWQSEFLSVAAIVILSVYLRQRGSPESKPVAAPHAETGE